MKTEALTYLQKQLRKKRIALLDAGRKKNARQREIDDILDKIAVIEYLIGLVESEA